MKNNSQMDDIQEINWSQVINNMIASKKIILLSTIFFSLVAIYIAVSKPTIFISNLQIEIGRFDSNNSGSTLRVQNLIEQPEELIDDLLINFIYKQDKLLKNLSFDVQKGGVFLIQTRSPSGQMNESALNEMFSYVKDRHKTISSIKNNQLKNSINTKIDLLNTEVKFSKNQILNAFKLKETSTKQSIATIQNLIDIRKAETIIQKAEDRLTIEESIASIQNLIVIRKAETKIQKTEEKLAIEESIASIQNLIDIEKNLIDIENYLKTERALEIKQTLPTLEEKIILLNKIIEEDQLSLNLLKTSPTLFIQRTAQSPTLDQVIYSYKTLLVDYELEISTLKNELVNLNKSTNIDSNNSGSLLTMGTSTYMRKTIDELIFEKNKNEYQLELINLALNDDENFDPLILELKHEKNSKENELVLLNEKFFDPLILELEHEKNSKENELLLSKEFILDSNELSNSDYVDFTNEDDINEKIVTFNNMLIQRLRLEKSLESSLTSTIETTSIGGIKTYEANKRSEFTILLGIIFGLGVGVLTSLFIYRKKT